jgi:hypothetical protein
MGIREDCGLEGNAVDERFSTARVLKVRAHHLLCMQGFQGSGYSPEFVENFIKILDQVHENFYETEFEVTDNIDPALTTKMVCVKKI